MNRKSDRKSYWLVAALLAAVMALAACGGSGTDGAAGGTGSGTSEEGAAPNVPASDATVAAQGGDAAGDAAGGDVVSEGANGSNDATGAGDASGGNAGNAAGAATDVGSGSDGAQGSGGSNGAGGTTSPESDLGAPAGDETGNAQSGTGDAATGTDTTGTDATGTDASGAQGGTAGGAATGTGQNDAQAAGTGGAYTPVADAECTALQEQLTTALGVDVTRATMPAAFSDLSGGMGESCQLTMAGTGEQFPSLADAAQRIGQVLTGAGWTADPQYAADGPTGTIGGLRRDNQLAAYNVEWSPGPAASCPADQPVATCLEGLAPDQVMYNITVDLAQQ